MPLFPLLFNRYSPREAHAGVHGWQRYLVALSVSFFAVVLLRNAWLCDDAYITLRTVDNFINGYGLTWNVAERVQSYTHPLWMFLLSLFYWVTHEAYYTTVLVASGLSILAVSILAFRVAVTGWSAVVAVLVLTVSKTFVDFSTSGLENPLSFVIIAIFFTIYFRSQLSPKTVFWLSLWAALGILTRIDNALILIPALVFAGWGVQKWKALGTVFIGMMPLWVWEVFSMLYYGFPIPNTAYAKLNTGIAASDLINQGLHYLLDTVMMSPVTALIIFMAILVPLVSRAAKLIPFGIGLLLYLIYVVKVGGDFMTGRFLATPMYVSVLMLSRFEMSTLHPGRLAFGATLVLAALVWPLCPVFSGSTMGKGPEAKYWNRGIGDERSAIFQYTGLLNGPNSIKDHPWTVEGIAARDTGARVVVRTGIGIFGYYAGPGVHIVDKHALGDPLLARLPVWTPKSWRPGHFTRFIPKGYLETLQTGENCIDDPDLKAYYDKLSLVIHGKRLNWQTIKEILKINFGAYNHLVRSYTSRPMFKINYDEVSVPVREGTYALHADCHVLPPSGIQIEFDSVHHENHLDIGVDHNDDYLIEYYLRGTAVASQVVTEQWIPSHGIRRGIVEIDRAASETGFDRIVIIGQGGDGVYAVGHLRLLDLSPGERIRELLQSKFSLPVNLKDITNLTPSGWDYGDSLTLAALYVVPDKDSVHILLAYRVHHDLGGNYKIFLHLAPVDGSDKFGNFDFLPSRRTHMWKKGNIEVFDRAVPNPGKPFRIATGLFDSNGRLGTAFRATCDLKSH